MRGLLATLSVLSAAASLIVSLTYLTQRIDELRTFSIILWATTLTVGAVSGAAARKHAARKRAGLMRSTIALFVCIASLIVGVISFLI